MWRREKKDSGEKMTEIWRKYQAGVEYHHKINLTGRTDTAHRFYHGDQWAGLESGGEQLPVANFIKPVVKYKVSVVAQNTMTAVFTPFFDHPVEKEICNHLTKFFARQWERGKMDAISWKVIKDACIQGDSYLYFGGEDVSTVQVVDNVNVFLSDEQNSQIQEQKYILLRERLFVADVRQRAKENGLEEAEIALIVPDDDTEDQIGNRTEVEAGSDQGKCISLLYLERDKDGYIRMARSTKSVIYEPFRLLRQKKSDGSFSAGQKCFPLVSFLWEEKKGSARGVGEVEQLMANQMEINRTLARRSIAIKQMAYPKMAYVEGAVQNPDELDLIGGKLALNGMDARAINQMVAYLNPAVISPDAKNFSDELMQVSRELAGAGDSATGSIDPTKASGTAIIAVRDQAALPLNEQVATYHQFVEDLAKLWVDVWITYHPEGLLVQVEGRKVVVTPEELERMKFEVKIDVSKTNPFSLYAEEQSLHNYWQAQAISFEELVEALPEGSAAPKNKLMALLQKRQMAQEQQQQTQGALEQAVRQAQAYGAQVETLTAALNDMTSRMGESGQADRFMPV